MWVKSTGFHRLNLPDFRVKSGGFHEILGHSPYPAFIKLKSFCWNTCFYNLGGFHRWNLGEICQISWVKSLVIAPTLHSSNWRVFAETLAFIILGGFHRSNLGEIHQISWLKSTRFQGEIHQISRVKSPTLHSSKWRVFSETLAFIILGGFHRWYLGEICRISPEICWISWISWNLLDFMVKSVWNPPDFMKSVWNPPDFMECEVLRDDQV